MRPTHPRHSITILLSLLFAGLFPNTAAAQVISGTWSATGPMSSVRSGAAASLLQDGRVLITGGTDASGPLSSAEVYSSGSFWSAGAMLLARSNHASVTLQDGRVLVLGGSTASGPTNETEIYNPSTNAWTVGNPMAASRSGHTATLLKDGRVLIAGGSGSGAPGTTLEIFNPATGMFSLASSLSASRSNHAAALLADGRVLITGGYNSSTALNSSDIYDPSSGTVSPGPSMSTPRALHTATTLLNGDVLIAGGNNGSSDVSSAEIYSGTGFSSTGSLGSARSGHRAFLLPNNNSVLIVGGSALTAELYRSWSSSFVTTGSPSVPRTGGAGGPLASDGLLLMAGGGNSSAELYPFATVKTDKDDYHPGEVATITGSGWQPGENVTLHLLESPFYDTHGPYTAVADANGRISNNQFVPDEDDVSIRFYLTATGSVSNAQAQTTFTDAGLQNLTVSVQSPNPVPAGSTASYTVTVNFNGNSNSCTINLSTITGSGETGLPAGTNVSFTPSSVTGVGGNTKTTTLSIGTTAGTTLPGTYTFTVRGSLTAGCQGTQPGDASASLVVAAAPNTPPTVAANNASVTVNEGQTATNTGTYSDADSGDNVAITASVGSVTKTGTSSGTWNWSFGTTDGPAQSQTVTITANDGHGGITTTTFSLTVNNVAPTATFNAPGSVNEGSSINLSLTAPSDPSSVDTTAGFTYAFDCGSGYGAFASTNTASCSTTDNGTRTVKGKIRDKDNGETEYTASVTINNVAPTASLANNGPINEGASANLTFTAQTDPSSADTTAGFHYAYDCTNGSLAAATYANSGTSATTTCSFDDNGLKTVKARIIDKDDGFTEYTTAVTVNNVAPTATFTGPVTANEGDSKTYSFASPSDVSNADTTAGFHYAYDCNGGSLNTATYAASGTSLSTSCTFTDNGNKTIRGRIIDKDEGFTEYTVSVTVDNVAPTATIANNGPVNEGSPATISFSNQLDPSSVDTAAGFHYAYSCTNGDLSGSTYAGSGTSASNPCTFNDNGSYTVKARIIDKDNGFTEYTTSVTVNNVAPTASLTNNGPINEGGSATISFSGQTDPSSVDTTAGFHYAYECTNGSLTAATYATSGSTATTSCSFDDNGPKTVKARIIDKDDGFTEYTTVVTVNNVPPVATFTGPATANEGDSKAYSFSSPSDPSSADTAAGFHYAFECTGGSLMAATYSGSGTSSSTACTFTDSGNKTVRARIIDKDDGFTEYTVAVDVANVAPTATLANNGPVNEGSPATISFSNQFDPSSIDTAAGFHYAYSCTNGDLSGSTYAASSANPSDACTFNDNGSYTVKARIIDKDGGFTEYTTTVTVNNVAPTATFANNGPINEGTSAAVSFTAPSDPSTADTTAGFHYSFACDGSMASLAGSYAAAGTTATINCPFGDNGSFAVLGRIFDKDNGYTQYSTTVVVNNVAPTATLNAPISADEGSSISLSLTNPQDVAADLATLTYAFDCGNGFVDYGSVSTATCTAIDNPFQLVKGRVKDKDGGFTDYPATVIVNNLPPTVTAAGNQNTNEGTMTSFSIGSFSDPGVNDSPWTVTVSWGDSTPNTVFNTATQGVLSSPTHKYDDNGVYTVTVTVKDKDNANSTPVSFQVTVANVAPTATLANNGPINEGTSAMVSFTGATDPSSTDTTAGFHYSFACDGNPASLAGTYAAAGMTATINCPFGDNGSFPVLGRVFDKDNGYTEYSTTVVVNNVAPTATFNSPISADEGSSIILSLTNPQDVAADLPTLTYAFDCGTGFGTYSNVSTATCTAIDNPSQLVKGRVKDKDGGYTDYMATVIVNNLPPTVVAAGNQNANEGTLTSFSIGSFSDPGVNDSPWTVTVNWGDGTANTVFNTNSQGVLSSPTHKYDDNNVYTVTVTVKDKDNVTSTPVSFQVTVANVAPTATLSNNGPINEGTSVTVSFSAATDPSNADTAAGFHYSFACNGNPASLASTYAAAGTVTTINCPFGDNGSFSVYGRIFDKDNGYTEYSRTVVVDNVAPTATFNIPGVSVNEGSPFNISLTSPVDVPADLSTLQYAFDCGTGFGLYSATSNASCTAVNDPGQTVKGRIKDKDGGMTEYTRTVVVANVAPSNLLVSLVGASINENGMATLNGSFADPGTQDVHTVSITWGDGLTTTATITPTGSRSFSAMHQYLDDGPYPGNNSSSDIYSISVTVADNSSTPGTVAAGTQITVNNVAPAIDSSSTITVPVTPMQVPANPTIGVNVLFTDVGSQDRHTCTINFDDATNVAGYVSETVGSGSGTCSYSGNHVFSAPGVYVVSVDIKDDDTGKTSLNASSMIVVYDPNGGFVTGGGWINSPPGAFPANPSLVGKANFGFVSKYQKGATIPTGETEFQFQTGNLNFHSTAYEWLVVAGARAQYKGSGTIKGMNGTFGFMLTAIDGQVAGGGGVDKFRMKIWDSNGAIVYDNQLGLNDDGDPTTTLGGGSIVVHK